MPEVSERSFEEAIECGLLQHGPDACAGDTTVIRETPPPYGDTMLGGYRKRSPTDYDRALCLIPRDVVDFILATQPKEDDKLVTHAVLKTIAAFLNTEGGDLLIGVADDGSIVGIEYDRLETDDKFMRHLAQVVRNGLGDRASTCIDPKTQIIQGKTVCLVSCQRSPEPVFLKWKGTEASPDGDFYVRSGPGSVRLVPESAEGFIRTRFPAASKPAGA